MASIVPDAFTAFAFVKANGLAAADVEEFDDQVPGDHSAGRAAALHGSSFALRRIFLGIRPHRGSALADGPCERIKMRFEPSLTAKAKLGVSLCYDGAHSYELIPPIHPSSAAELREGPQPSMHYAAEDNFAPAA